MRDVKMKAKTNLSILAPIVVRSDDQLANAIKRLRKMQGLSQAELAKKAGVTQPTVSRIEQGSKAAEVGTIFLLLSALNIDLQVIPRVQNKRGNSLEGLI